MSYSIPQIPMGVGPPVALNIVLVPQPNLDFTTVTGVSIQVQPPQGLPILTWSAFIVGTPTPTSLSVGHTFAAADTLPALGGPGLGNYLLVVQLTVSGGTIPSYPATLIQVVPPFGGGVNTG